MESKKEKEMEKSERNIKLITNEVKATLERLEELLYRFLINDGVYINIRQEGYFDDLNINHKLCYKKLEQSFQRIQFVLDELQKINK